MIANYFDSSQKVQAEISQEKEEKMAISKKETILTAEETSHQRRKFADRYR